MSQTEALLKALKMTARHAVLNPYTRGMPNGSKDFICTLHCSDRKMDVYQSTGPGVSEPVLADVVEFLLDDTKEMLKPFDSSKADWEAKFQRRALETRAENFATLLGGELYQHVLKHIGVT